ncbi:hypothetical protein PR048_010832 [Dryococelus australis]|uniref:Uncharacterized protein n=1 Tax=Dryococelus australis TaxID=614101 RepID=A0ABQ9I3V1_9NEOP|nr:hypothetical protein PR048_010832 [Dryococelus australis]
MFPTYALLQRFIDLSDVMGVVILNIPESPPMLTGSELASIKLIVQITLELSAEKIPNASKVIGYPSFKRLHFQSLVAPVQAIVDVVKATKTSQEHIASAAAAAATNTSDVWLEHDSAVFINPAEKKNLLMVRYLQNLNST